MKIIAFSFYQKAKNPLVENFDNVDETYEHVGTYNSSGQAHGSNVYKGPKGGLYYRNKNGNLCPISRDKAMTAIDYF